MSHLPSLVQVHQGPQLMVSMVADVITPAVCPSTDCIDFGVVKCGECRVVSVQLVNEQLVPCAWRYSQSSSDDQNADSSKLKRFTKVC